MAQAAVSLMDLQRDFLDADDARMPVDASGAASVLRNANAVLAKRALETSIPVLVAAHGKR